MTQPDAVRPQQPLVTVITPTRGRPDAVRAAIMSVCAQTIQAVEHLVIGDDCPYLARPSILSALQHDFPAVAIDNVQPGDPGCTYRPARTARIRNIGISRARGRFIAHLDDDNSFEPDHLATLVASLDDHPAAVAAHSWRALVDRRGDPYVPEPFNPWISEPAESARNYAELADSGVFASGSNVMRDRITGRRGQNFFLVDVSELLVRAEFHRYHPFRTAYSAPEMAAGLCEDRAWCIEVSQAGRELVQSMQVTLRYTMGGYSNGPVGPAEIPEVS